MRVCFFVFLFGFQVPVEDIVGLRVPYCVLREETADRLRGCGEG
jgi:hypothetical protein